MNGFDSARLKIDRADKHITDLEGIIGPLPVRYTCSIEIDPQGRGHSIKYEIANFPKIDSDMALITGDALHNLKTALDHCWLELVGSGNRHRKFPVRDTAQELNGALHGANIDRTHPEVFKWIFDHAKPYKGGMFDLWCLHELDIADKHRLLLPVVRNAWIIGIVVEDQDGIHKGNSMLAQGLNVLRFDFERHVKIHDKGKLSLEVCFADGLATESLEILDTLKRYRRLTVDLIERMERIS